MVERVRKTGVLWKDDPVERVLGVRPRNRIPNKFFLAL
jgi:hypothetical protein